jgi:hypothetical protein
MTDRERQLRTRLRADFAFYAPRVLRIRTKAGEVKPFTLNTAQEHLHAALERQRAETGRVRAIVLKGRQQGCSTYVQGRFFWRVTQSRGARAFILTHLDDATNNLFGMAKRFQENCPPLVRPSLRASNAKELIFDKLDSGYKIGTAGSAGVGRSDTIQYFHGSEAAYWPNADKHMSGALQAVPDEPGTEVILESTSTGPFGVFYDRAMQAMQGEGDYHLIFIPWFWQAEYRRMPPRGFEMNGEERGYADAHGLNSGQMAWRRAKIVELGGLHNFRREYPATPEEAFRVEAPSALWKRPLLDALRVHKTPPLRRIVVAIDPSGGAGPRNNEVGIVVAGIAHDHTVYVLEDASAKYTPNEWGQKAVALFDRWKADRIIGERNFGGDMVESTIRTVRRTVSYKDVEASRGKAVRAEPVKALYEQGRVHHVGMFPAMEDEMVTWEPGVSKFSPNRLDALVWAATELALQEGISQIERFRALA